MKIKKRKTQKWKWGGCSDDIRYILSYFSVASTISVLFDRLTSLNFHCYFKIYQLEKLKERIIINMLQFLYILGSLNLRNV